MKTRNLLIILGIVFVILLFLVTTISIRRLSTIPYVSQCSLPSCPSGYTSVDVYCDNYRNKCYRECEKQLAGSCGSYGSFSRVESRTVTWDGSNHHGDYFNTGSYRVSSDYCYRFFSQSYFTVSSWGTASSYKVYSFDAWGNSDNSCSTSSSKLADTSPYTLGRGTDGRAYSAQGLVYNYGASTCSGGTPFNDLEGKLNIYLYMSRASWNEGGIAEDTVSCSYECDVDGECSSDTWVGTPTCSRDNVYQTFRDYYCSSYSCSYSDLSKLKESCKYGCLNGACIIGECVDGETKCEGAIYYTCSNNNWVSQGELIGKCGVECLSDSNCLGDGYIGEEYCSGDNIVRKYVSSSCVNNQCIESEIEKVIDECIFGCEAGTCLTIEEPPQPKPLVIQFFIDIWDWIKGIFGD